MKKRMAKRLQYVVTLQQPGTILTQWTKAGIGLQTERTVPLPNGIQFIAMTRYPTTGLSRRTGLATETWPLTSIKRRAEAKTSSTSSRTVRPLTPRAIPTTEWFTSPSPGKLHLRAPSPCSAPQAV